MKVLFKYLHGGGAAVPECKICGLPFENGRFLRGHMTRVHIEKIPCHVCGQMVNPGHMDQHSRVHKNDRPCLSCGKIIHATRNNWRNRFCSHGCAAKFNNPKRAVRPVVSQNCLWCGKTIAPRNRYCSSLCQSNLRRKQYIERWLAGQVSGNDVGKMDIDVNAYVRQWFLGRSGNKCEKCGWSERNPFNGKIPLTLHHKDGDATCTTPENVEVLCPNCHSLTKTYGGLNRGKGRASRRVRYARDRQLPIQGEHHATDL
jgi:predicted nucleic acid-binding Zn ribbon protein